MEAIVSEQNPNRGRGGVVGGWAGRYIGECGVFLLAPTVTDCLPVAAARLNRTVAADAAETVLCCCIGLASYTLLLSVREDDGGDSRRNAVL